MLNARTDLMPRIMAVLTTRGALVVALSALACLSFFWLVAGFCQTCSTDYNQVYEPIARRIARDPDAVARPSMTYYPPGYPLVLGVVFRFTKALAIPEVWAIQALFAASMMGGALLLFAIASEVWPQPAALVAPLVWITYPPALWLTKQPNSEVIFCPVLFGSLFFAITGLARSQLWRFAASGALAGAAMLIRPIAVGLPIVLAITALLLSRDNTLSRRFLSAALLIVVSALVVLPWQWRVSRERGPWVPLGGVGAPSIVHGLTFDVSPRGKRGGIIQDTEVRALMSALEARGAAAGSLRKLAVMISEEARARPGAALKLLLIKSARSWYGTESQRHDTKTLPIQLLYLGLAAMAGRKAYRRKGLDRTIVIAVGLTVLYFWAMTITVLSILRYMTPAMALLFLLLPALVDRSDSDDTPSALEV